MNPFNTALWTWIFATALGLAGASGALAQVPGTVTTNFGPNTNDIAGGGDIQPDGKIVIGGASCPLGGPCRLGLARYNPGGSLDATFGTGGLVTTNFGPGTDDRGGAAVIQPDGKIVAGSSSCPAGAPCRFALARYNPDGSLDVTFGTGGLVTTNFGPGTNDIPNGGALQPDGKGVVVGASCPPGAPCRFGLARYNPDGSLDATFGTGGLVTTNFGPGTTDEAQGVVIQADGNIVVVGTSCLAGAQCFSVPGFDCPPFAPCRFGLTRYNPDGSLDATFGTGGLVTTNFGAGTTDQATGVVIQADGNIVVAGDSCPPGAPCRFALARYNADGSLDATFGTGGLVTTNFGPGTVDLVDAVSIQADGNIVVAGASCSPPPTTCSFGLARYNPDGSLDATFGTGGLTTTSFGAGVGRSDVVNGLIIQVDGKILASGASGPSGGPSSFALARYNVDGSLDASFGSLGMGGGL